MIYEAVADQYRALAGEVDDGPNAWAVLLATAIVSLAIALAILVEGLI